MYGAVGAFGQTPGAYGPSMAYKDGVLGQILPRGMLAPTLTRPRRAPMLKSPVPRCPATKQETIALIASALCSRTGIAEIPYKVSVCKAPFEGGWITFHGRGNTCEAARKDAASALHGFGEYFVPLGQNEEEAAEAAADEEEKKKNLMIYGGIAVGVVVLGGIAYFATKKRR